MSKVFTDIAEHSQYPGEMQSSKGIGVSNALKQTIPELQTKIQSII